MTNLERFIACMEYQEADQRPNHEVGVWTQTLVRWQKEGFKADSDFPWLWFEGLDKFNHPIDNPEENKQNGYQIFSQG